jgi:hypothetical protein
MVVDCPPPSSTTDDTCIGGSFYHYQLDLFDEIKIPNVVVSNFILYLANSTGSQATGTVVEFTDFATPTDHAREISFSGDKHSGKNLFAGMLSWRGASREDEINEYRLYQGRIAKVDETGSSTPNFNYY